MKVPDAIQKQADTAEKLQKQLATGTPVEIVEDAPKMTVQSDFVSSEPGKPPAQVVNVAKEQVTEPTPVQPQGNEWEHKYNVLQGKYNTDLTELRAQLESQAGTIANLNSLVTSLNSRPTEPATPIDSGQPQDGQVDDVLSTESFNGYGAEIIDLVKLVKKQASEIAGLKGETNKLAERQVKSEADVYYEALDGAVENWRTLNKDAGFLAWLAQPDGLSGVSRQDNMTAAHTALDVRSVAKYFLAYAANGNTTKPETQPASQPGTTRPDLSQQVVPFDTGVRTEITQPGEAQDVIVTKEQFNKAVTDNIKGRITEEQFKVISNNFQRSIAAGQI